MNEDLEELWLEDWQLAQTIIRALVPNAVLCYTGDLVEDESESESSESSSEDSIDSNHTSDDSQ